MAVGTAAIVLGVFIFVIAGSIQGFGDDPVGPKFVPRAVATLISLIGAFLALRAWTAAHRGEVAADPADAVEPERTGAVAVLAVASVVYALLFQAIGYAPTTLLIFPIVLYLFGMRGVAILAGYAVGAFCVFYLFFFVLLGIYDPPGQWFDPLAFLR